MISIYIAASFGDKARVRRYATDLRCLGYAVADRWTNHAFPFEGDQTNIQNQAYSSVAASEDLNDVKNSQIFVLLTTPEDDDGSRSFGRMVEFGYALHSCAVCCIVGDLTNIFCTLEAVKRFETFDDFVAWLTGEYR